MSLAIIAQRVEAWLALLHLVRRARRRIVLQHRFDIVAEVFQCHCDHCAMIPTARQPALCSRDRTPASNRGGGSGTISNPTETVKFVSPEMPETTVQFLRQRWDFGRRAARRGGRDA